MPATTKLTEDEVKQAISKVLVDRIPRGLGAVWSHEKFDGKKRLFTSVKKIAAWANHFTAAVKDSSGISPKLTGPQILFFNPTTVGDLTSLIYNRLRNRDADFIKKKVMTTLKSQDDPPADENATFVSCGWKTGTIHNVIKSVRSDMSRDIDFDTSISTMYTAKNGADLIRMITADFSNQQRL